MNIILKSTHIDVSPFLSDYITQRFSSLEKYIGSFEKDQDVPLRIELARTTRHHKKGEGVYYVECTIVICGKTVRIEQYDADIRGAVDAARNRLKREFEKLKGVIQDRNKRGLNPTRGE